MSVERQELGQQGHKDNPSPGGVSVAAEVTPHELAGPVEYRPIKIKSLSITLWSARCHKECLVDAPEDSEHVKLRVRPRRKK